MDKVGKSLTVTATFEREFPMRKDMLFVYAEIRFKHGGAPKPYKSN